MNYNEVILSGILNNILENELYVTIGLTCNKYSKEEKNNLVYASLRIYRDLYEKYKGLFLLNNKIYIKGYLNSYSDKNNKIHNYVTITKVDNYDFFNGNKTISYDIDGVMLWNGKRCESKLATEEEIKEMEKQLKEIENLIISK